jgi:hypothetical protein
MAELGDLEKVISNLSGFHEPNALENRNEEKQVVSNGSQENDPNVVDWEGPDDPENPMNWPHWRKIIAVGIVSAITFVT